MTAFIIMPLSLKVENTQRDNYYYNTMKEYLSFVIITSNKLFKTEIELGIILLALLCSQYIIINAKTVLTNQQRISVIV